MSYESISAKYVKARSEHQCVWCGEKILKGEDHLSRAYRFDGSFQRDRVHAECEKAMGVDDDASEGFEPCNQERGKTIRESEAIRDAECHAEDAEAGGKKE